MIQTSELISCTRCASIQVAEVHKVEAGVGRRKSVGQIDNRVKTFSVLQNAPDWPWDPSSLLSIYTAGCFPGVKRTGRETELRTSGAGLRMRGVILPLPYIPSWCGS